MNCICGNPFWHPLKLRAALARLSAGGFASLLFALSLTAQDATKPSLPPGRFLFMVDMSLSMRGRADGMLRAVEALLASDLDGRLRPGDTIGLWTFNQEVHAGRFPLQTWTPATRSATSVNLLAFLRQQRYEKKTDLEQALRKALPLVRASPAITLLVFTDGGQPVRGTPFDDAINTAFREARRAQARARMPFVVVLRAERGQIASHVVGLPPWPIEIPPLPGELRALAASQSPRKPDPKESTAAAVAPRPPSGVPVKPAQVKSAEPSKPEPVAAKPPQPVVTFPAVAEKPPEARPVESPPVAAAKPAAAPASEVAPAKLQPAAEPPKPPAQTPTLSPPSPQPVRPVETVKIAEVTAPPSVAAEPIAPAVTKDSPVDIPPSEASELRAIKVSPPESSPPAEAKPNATDVVIKSEPVVTAEPPPSKPAEAKTSAATLDSPSSAHPSPAPQPPEAAKPAEPPSAATPHLDRAQPGATALQGPAVADAKPAAPDRPGVESTAVPAGATAPIQTALVVPPPPFLSGPRLLALGLLLLGVAGVLFFLIVRRSHASGTPGSLITQSFDRGDHDRKQP